MQSQYVQEDYLGTSEGKSGVFKSVYENKLHTSLKSFHTLLNTLGLDTACKMMHELIHVSEK